MWVGMLIENRRKKLNKQINKWNHSNNTDPKFCKKKKNCQKCWICRKIKNHPETPKSKALTRIHTQMEQPLIQLNRETTVVRPFLRSIFCSIFFEFLRSSIENEIYSNFDLCMGKMGWIEIKFGKCSKSHIWWNPEKKICQI